MADRMTTSAAPNILVDGQRLDQPTFHAMYEAMPPGTRAELIDGVVSISSPVGLEHAQAQVPVIVWLAYYAEQTPGFEVLDNTTTILDSKCEPQPDALLRNLPEYGGRTWVEGGYVHGAPELIVEVSKATRYVDMGPKKTDYERAGVLEYVVARSTRTRSSGTSRNKACWCESGSVTMVCIVPRSFRASGSIRSRSWRAIRVGSAPWLIWAAPRPNTPIS